MAAPAETEPIEQRSVLYRIVLQSAASTLRHLEREGLSSTDRNLHGRKDRRCRLRSFVHVRLDSEQTMAKALIRLYS